MSLYVKGLVQKEYEKRFKGLGSFIVLQTRGIKGVDNNKMRGELKQKGVRMMVVRNSMVRRAFAGLGMSDAGVLFEAGPCTVVYGGYSIVDAAKAIDAWFKKLKVMSFKGAFVEGQVLDAAGAERLSKMPTRAESQGRIVQLALSPGSRLAAGIQAGAGGLIAGCLKTIIENKEKQEAA
jgi:large subunit ribosomal protein L10